jgi:hypothetical protein
MTKIPYAPIKGEPTAARALVHVLVEQLIKEPFPSMRTWRMSHKRPGSS